jgi:hypothetical protein
VGPQGEQGPAGPTYTLSVASTSTLGGIKVGTGLSIDGSGVLSGLSSIDGYSTSTNVNTSTWTTSNWSWASPSGNDFYGFTTDTAFYAKLKTVESGDTVIFKTAGGDLFPHVIDHVHTDAYAAGYFHIYTTDSIGFITPVSLDLVHTSNLITLAYPVKFNASGITVPSSGLQFNDTRVTTTTVTLGGAMGSGAGHDYYGGGSGATRNGTAIALIGKADSTEVAKLLLLKVGDTLTITTNLGTATATLASVFTTSDGGGGLVQYNATTVESVAFSFIQDDIVFNLTSSASVTPITISQAGIKFEDNTVQNTAYILQTPPTHSTGKTGDKAGMVAYDSNYHYYCTTNYTDGVSDIWVRVAWTGTTW